MTSCLFAFPFPPLIFSLSAKQGNCSSQSVAVVAQWNVFFPMLLCLSKLKPSGRRSHNPLRVHCNGTATFHWNWPLASSEYSYVFLLLLNDLEKVSKEMQQACGSLFRWSYLPSWKQLQRPYITPKLSDVNKGAITAQHYRDFSSFPQTVDWTCDLCVGGWDVLILAYDLATVIK